MSEPDFARHPHTLAEARVAILGLGLMGGSLALALRGSCATLLGFDPDPAIRSDASTRKIVDRVFADPATLMPEADLVVLAAPVGGILSLIQALPDLHPGRAVVMDLGSTKVSILQALAGLPDRFDPLGGHPMCGKEQAGLAHAAWDLYQGAAFALVSLPRTSPHARQLASSLVMAVGAEPLWIDAETHDRWVAATSHMPYLMATALALATPTDVRPLVGPGFRSTARLAASSPEVMLDVLLTNRVAILTALQRFRAQVDRLESGLARNDATALGVLLAQAVSRQQQLTSSEHRRD